MSNRLIRLSPRRIIAAFARKFPINWLNWIVNIPIPITDFSPWHTNATCKCDTRPRDGSCSYGNGSYSNKPDTLHLTFANPNAITRITLVPLLHSFSPFSNQLPRDMNTYLQYLTSIRYTLVVHAWLIHPERDAVQKDHHHAHPFEPRESLLRKS